jgi:predicted TIM-barrel fold metal-dependent hydrolase
MLEDSVQLVSVDDHVIEHPRVWEDRLPAALRERGPRVIQTDDGRAGWEYDGYRTSTIGLNAVAGKPPEERGLDPVRFAEMRPGCYDPAARVKDMDEDGVQVQTCFPDFPGFAGRVFIKAPDKALALLCLQAWNDFMLDEWCAAAPDRFIPMVLLPVWDIPASVAELQRTVARGARAISFLERPDGLGLPSIFTDHWDPLLAAAQEADIPLCTHFGTGGALEVADDRPLAIRWTVGGQRSMTSAADLLYSPVFRKFPRLRVVLSEGGIGWMPYLLERADYVWERHRWYQDVDRSIRPSELFVDHIFGCFISDRAGVRDRYAIGVEQIMWESDYPHADSNFPLARKVLEEELADVPSHESRLIAEDNARRIFRFPRQEGAPA